jgi:lipoprotein-releasing system ATP-binding protein
MNNVIEVKDLYKSYNNGPQKVEVIRGIDLAIKEKEIAIIMGPSGAGKSTLLHVMGLLDEVDKGQIVIDGTDIATLGEERKARLRSKTIGFVFQFHHLLPEFSALENVLMPTMIFGNAAEHEEYALHILEKVGLSHRLTHKPRELSGGEQQRVAVARAIVNKPRIVFADEPTGNLDKRNSEALFQLLLKLNEELNQTLLIVTHSDQMASNANRIIELEDGKIISQSKSN